MFFAHLDQVAEGDSTPGRRLLRRDGFHAFFQFDPKLPLELADERVARADGAGLELRDDADPLVDLRAEIRLLPSAGLPSLTDPLRKVVREFEFAGLGVHVPGGHSSLAHLQPLRDDGGHRALPQCRRRDLIAEPRTVRTNRQNGRVDGHILQARHVGATQFADHESSPQRLNKKCLVYSFVFPPSHRTILWTTTRYANSRRKCRSGSPPLRTKTTSSWRPPVGPRARNGTSRPRWAASKKRSGGSSRSSTGSRVRPSSSGTSGTS